MSTVKDVGRRAALAAADQLGQRTASRRALPTMLIVGAQRCGTTTLFKALCQHPSFVGPTLRKGVHYFDLNSERPLDWYRAHFPTKSSIAALQQRTGSGVVVGESSPYYLWHPLAPQRIAQALPGVRVVALLRDPVERAYSAHAHELARGFESETFERALELEPQRLAGEEERVAAGEIARSMPHQHQAYLRRGEYVDQLERMARAVGRDHVLVLDSADFWADPESNWPTVTSFLGLPPGHVTVQQHNARSRAPMSPELRARLEAHYEPFDERLAQWWGRTPSWRR
ncbi:MAG TPA: sulfotransferase domain-containing protein [Actinomycetes bacterium]|nr:sulfotransferase domain-containing protein [Actinomycetes bacterium]